MTRRRNATTSMVYPMTSFCVFGKSWIHSWMKSKSKSYIGKLKHRTHKSTRMISLLWSNSLKMSSMRKKNRCHCRRILSKRMSSHSMKKTWNCSTINLTKVAAIEKALKATERAPKAIGKAPKQRVAVVLKLSGKISLMGRDLENPPLQLMVNYRLKTVVVMG